MVSEPEFCEVEDTKIIKHTTMSTSKNMENEGSWRPLVLKSGEYDRWVFEIKSYIMSMDVECWKVIKKFDYLHLDEKKEAREIRDLSEAELKEFEKNHKALRLLTIGLGDCDKRKVLACLTAKDKWDALEKIHFEFEDVKQDRIAALTQDYNNLCMCENETIEEFQVRFLF